MLTKTGTFNAATVTGNQSVAGVGFAPKALILWGVGATNEAEFNTIWFTQGIGFSTSPTNQYAQSSAAIASSSTATQRRMESCAFLQTNVSATDIVRRADLVSMDPDGFTLNWTIARSTGAYKVLHYLALGGADLTGATVVNWQTPLSTGLHAVTGVGFQPDCVLHVHAGAVTTLTDGGNAVTSAGLGLGAMTASGGQWATGYVTSSTSAHARNQEADKTLTIVSASGSVGNQAVFSSMDTDGFSLNFGIAQNFALQAFSLCLKGGQYNVGRVIKSTSAAPVTDTVSSLGFAPTGVLLAGVQDIARTAPLAGSGVAYGMGASDGTSQWGTALYGADTASRTNIAKSTKGSIKHNSATKAIDAEADLSLTSDGFALNWTTNDAVATSIPYIAFGSLATGPTSQSVTDSGVVAGADAATRASAATVADSGVVTGTDTAARASASTLADSGVVTSTDAVSISAITAKVATDSEVVAGSEVVSGATTGTVADSGLVTGTDAASVTAVTAKTATDSGIVAGADTATAADSMTASDSGLVTGTDTAAISDQTAKIATDTQAITSSDTATVSGQAAVSAPSVVQTASNQNGGGATTLDLTFAAAPTLGNLMLAAISVRGGSGVTITPPAGWTLVRRTNNGTTIALAVYSRINESGAASTYTWTFSTSQKASGGIREISGQHPTTWQVAENGDTNASSTTHTTASISPAAGGPYLVSTSFGTATGATGTEETGWTEGYDQSTSGGSAGTRTTSEGQSREWTGGSITGSVLWGTAAVGASHIIAIAPAPDAPSSEPKAANDTQAITSSDTATVVGQAALSAPDAQSLTSTDTASTAITATVADAQAIASTDGAISSGTSAIADTQSVTSTDAASNAATNVVTDTQAIGASETTVISEQATKAATDAQAVASTDTATLAATSTVADTQGIAASETTTITRSSAVVDTQALTGTDAVSQAATSAVADAGAISAAETTTVSEQGTKSASDTQAIASLDVASVIEQSARIATDAQALASTDTATTARAATIADAQAITATESASASIDGTVPTDTTIIVGTDGVTLDVSGGVADTQGITATETVSVTVIVTVDDLQALSSADVASWLQGEIVTVVPDVWFAIPYRPADFTIPSRPADFTIPYRPAVFTIEEEP